MPLCDFEIVISAYFVGGAAGFRLVGRKALRNSYEKANILSRPVTLAPPQRDSHSIFAKVQTRF
jgi:hypothetical protein